MNRRECGGCEVMRAARVVGMAAIAQVRRFVNRALRDFEGGAFEGGEPVPGEQDEPGVLQLPAADFLPAAVGPLYQEMIEIEWHAPFDWQSLQDLADDLDADPLGAASLDGRTLCQLLVAHGRAERFCDGLFLSRIRSGQIRALLARVNVLSAGLKGPVSGLHSLEAVPPRRCRARPRRCSACRSSTIAPILYGLPAMDDALERKLEEGRLVIGGCLIGMDDPAWQCTTCGALVHVTGREDMDSSSPAV
jgi:hypothetical protein